MNKNVKKDNQNQVNNILDGNPALQNLESEKMQYGTWGWFSALTSLAFTGAISYIITTMILIPTNIVALPILFPLTAGLIATVLGTSYCLPKFFKCRKAVKMAKEKIKQQQIELEQMKLNEYLSKQEKTNQNNIVKDTYKNADNEVENSTNNTL